jgi:dTDP-4-amino-4,6-dideoxygalactose transaminase
VDLGSSILPGEIIAAFLWAQMEEADEITRRRLAIWDTYHQWLEPLEKAGKLRRPILPGGCVHNAHMYYLLLPDLEARNKLIEQLKRHDIYAVFHYVPLHSSPAGKIYGRVHGHLAITEDLADRLLRLPLWLGLENHQAKVIQHIIEALD